MFGFKRVVSHNSDKWEVQTRAGLMIRRHRYSGEMQYRDCATSSWRPVESEEHLDSLREQTQRVSDEVPEWIQHKRKRAVKIAWGFAA